MSSFLNLQKLETSEAFFSREFPRLKEAHAFYVCAKGPGTSIKRCIKNYSVPPEHEIKLSSLFVLNTKAFYNS
jgi:hypothetical protein